MRWKRDWEGEKTKKKDSQMYRTKSIAYRKERDKASVSLFYSLIMFSSIVQLGQVRLRGKRGECSGAISYHYVPVDISLSLSDSQLWFPPGHFPQMHKEAVLSWPPIKKKKKRTKASIQALTNKKATTCLTMSLLSHPHLLSSDMQSLSFLPPSLSACAVSILYCM